MRGLRSLLLCLFTLVWVSAGLAGPFLPYPNVGTPLSVGTNLFAAGGDVTVYFVGSDAYFDSVLWYNGSGPSTNTGLANHASTVGDSFSLGPIATGTPLLFRLAVDHKDGTFSDYYTGNPPAPNGDLEVHAYVTPWTDPLTPKGTPVNGQGYFVGFEDLHGAASDWDYNDHEFMVVVGNGIEHAPEPSTWMLAVGGVGALLLWRRKARLT